MATTAPPAQETQKAPAKLSLVVGLFLAVIGPLLFWVQMSAKVPGTPWYGPVLATLGLLLAFHAVRLKVNLWRIGVAVLCLASAGLQWFTTVVAFKVPEYTGPVKPGTTVPAFHAAFADGSAFNQDQLKSEQNTVLLFFRGRW